MHYWGKEGMGGEKGFTYIIIAVIIMMMTTMLFLISTNNYYRVSKAKAITDNYQNELRFTLNQGGDQLHELNTTFKEYFRSNNFHSKMCVVYVYDGYYYLSNFQDKEYSIIGDQKTIVLSREELEGDIEFGECSLKVNSDKKLNYYLEVYNGKEKKIVRENE